MRIAILSFAHARAATYAALLCAQPDVELIIADPGAPPNDPVRGHAVAARLGASYADGWDEALMMSPDAVLVSSETALRRELVQRAAAAGAHVLCANPLAMQEADVQAMIDACTRAKVGLTTMSPIIYSPGFAAVRRAVAAGVLGGLTTVRAAHNTAPPTGPYAWAADSRLAGGGAIVANTPYVTDLIDTLLDGELAEQVYAQGNKLLDESLDVETSALVSVRYSSGLVAAIDCSWSHSARNELKMTFVGEKASVDFDAFPQLFDGSTSLVGRERWEGSDADLDATMLGEFMFGVRSGCHPGPNGAAALRTVRIVRAAYRSLQTGQPVKLRNHAAL
jgi:predicted dehydrogenase